MSSAHASNIIDLGAFVRGFVVAVDFQEAQAIAAETELDSLPEWDSLATLGVILMCDTEYGVTITGDDLKNCVTVGDIYTKVASRKAA